MSLMGVLSQVRFEGLAGLDVVISTGDKPCGTCGMPIVAVPSGQPGGGMLPLVP